MRHRMPFFDVMVFHPNASSYHSQESQTLYKKFELAKKRMYNEKIESDPSDFFNLGWYG